MSSSRSVFSVSRLDDFDQSGLKPAVRPSQITFDVAGSHILLIDDVLNTGRTVRAAMNEIFDYGRPAKIDLEVLIDRGDRELPIAAVSSARRSSYQLQSASY